MKDEPTLPIQPNRTPLMVVISGPAGVGKDSVIAGLFARRLAIHFVVTATTRGPRTGELHGRDYYFVTTEEFQRMIAEDELVEYSLVYNDYKGVPKSEVRKAWETGKDVVLRVDVQGAAKIRKKYPECLLLFVAPPSIEALRDRLDARNSDSEEVKRLRLEKAMDEMGRIQEFDYVVVNNQDCLNETVDSIIAILRAEHLRVTPRRVTL